MFQGGEGGKVWLAHKADNLTAIYEPIVWKCGIFTYVYLFLIC
jgi:hypothetical protein